jgi:hypothetical protein
MGDGEAAVLGALRNNALRPKVHREVGPVVLAVAERVPGESQLLLPGFVLRHQPPERGEVDDDTVVEVRLPEGRDPPDFLEKSAQFLNQRSLRRKLRSLGGGSTVAQLAGERLEAPLLVSEFWRYVVVLDSEERILAESVT